MNGWPVIRSPAPHSPDSRSSLPGSMDAFGFVNINKPAGITSRKVVDRVARLVAPAKAGHAGTLDPMATGVLLVAVGPATRLIPEVHRHPKGYRARFLLGHRSETDDITGEELEELPHQPVTREDLESILPEFVGRIDQTPPQFSAIKVKGRRAYDLARKGRDVQLKPRPVEIHSLELLDFDGREFELDIECGSGTYVRSLGRDIGERLGSGAVMSQLVRTFVGPFPLAEAISVNGLNRDTLAAAIQPAVTAMPQLRRHCISAAQALRVRNGLPMTDVAGHTFTDREPVALLDEQGVLVAIGEYSSDNGEIAPKQVFHAAGQQ